MGQSVPELQAINERLRDFLDWIGEVPNLEEGLDGSKVAELLSTVLQAGECLRVHAAVPDPEWQQEILAYRKNLELLRGVLPLLEVQLRTERARLESERNHLEAASEWVISSRQTLRLDHFR